MFEADKPIRHVENDEYGRKKYVDNLAYAILTDDDSDGLIVGVEGEWGSGKTSIKNMLIERLQQMPLPSRKTHLIEFDAWMYSGSGEVVSALFSEISAGLSPRLKWYQRLRVRLSGYRGRAFKHAVQLGLDILGACPFPTNVNIAMAVVSWGFQALSEELSNDTLQGGTMSGRGAKTADNLRQTRDVLKRNLNSQSDRIVVFIDDLDRLLDDEIGSLIQAVKAVGDLPHVTYVLFYDKSYVAQALDKVSHDRGVEFLEKIVQIPAVVPELSLSDLHKSLKNEILRIGWRDNLSLGREQDIFNQCICPFIRSKRDMMRFLNDFRLYYAALGDDVELLDLAGITALRIFCSELYRWIGEKRNYLTDLEFVDNNSGMYVDRQRKKQKTLEHEIQDARDAGIFNGFPANWKEIVRVLFPFANKALGKQNLSRVPDSYRAICKKDHVDTYFRLVPSPENISEKRYKQFVCEINLDNAQPDADLMQVAYSPRLKGRIGRYLYRDTQQNARRMCMLLRFYLKHHFLIDLQFPLSTVEKYFYPYVLNLFELACEKRWNSANAEALLQECIDNENIGAFPIDIYLAMLCGLRSLPAQEEDWQRNRLSEIWDVEVGRHLGARSQMPSELDKKVDWGIYVDRFEKKVLSLAKKQLQDKGRDSLPVHLSFYDLRLTIAMLGWLFKDVPDALTDALLALRKYADEDQFVFLSAAALVIEQDDGSYAVDVQTAKHLFKSADYLNMVNSYVNDNELQHKTDRRYEQQLHHAAYAFALKGNGIVIQNGKVQVTADQANNVLKNWGLGFNSDNSL